MNDPSALYTLLIFPFLDEQRTEGVSQVVDADLPELGSAQGWIEPALEQIAMALRIPLTVREDQGVVALSGLEPSRPEEHPEGREVC